MWYDLSFALYCVLSSSRLLNSRSDGLQVVLSIGICVVAANQHVFSRAHKMESYVCGSGKGGR